MSGRSAGRPPPGRPPPWRALGLRREVALLVPVSLVLLLVLGGFTVLAYRGAVDRLSEERRQQALSLAERLRNEAERGAGAAAAVSLRRSLPDLRYVSIARPGGAASVRLGHSDWTLPAGTLPPPGGSRVLGPDRESRDAVIALARSRAAQGGVVVRLELDARVLAAQRRALDLLTVVVAVVGLVVVITVLVAASSLLRPLDLLIAKSRSLRGGDGAGGDEVGELLDTFERALAVLGAAPAGDGEVGADAGDLARLGRTLSASLESGLLLLTADGRILTLNRPARALLDLPGSHRGQAADEALAAHPALAAAVRAGVGEGRRVRRQECEIGSGAATRTVGVTVHPLRRPGDGAGPPHGFLVLFADLTEVRQRAREERLREGLAQLGELAAGVAHELRNSVATLGGYLELARRSGDAEERRALLAEVDQETAHLRRVVEDFLAFARPGTARVETVALLPLLRRLAADPARPGVEVVVDVAAGGGAAAGRVRGDAQLLERALANLLQNAVRAHAEAAAPGPVRVTLGTAADGWVRVGIEDRGEGVPAQLRETLFRPFVTGRADGSGLGLALVHRIVVSLHGGRVRLEAAEGGGTRAVVELPPGKIVTKGNEG